MHRKKILVPIGPHATNLKSVHYALALAERLDAQIYILQQAPPVNTDTQQTLWFNETLQDLFNDARRNKIALSHYFINTNFADEIIDLVKTEHIDMLVFSADAEVTESLLFHVKSQVPSQIIQVRDKNDIHCIKEGRNAYDTRHDIQFVSRGTGGAGRRFGQ